MRSPRARIVALAVGVGVIGSLAAAPASFAAAPPAGVNCQLDGKISGRGSTFQNNALNKALISGYTSDVCGPVGNASNLNSGYGGTDPAGSNMIAYNYSEAGTSVKNGSGAGISAMECRTDPFAGTDLPYSAAQLTAMNVSPPSSTGCPNLTIANTPYTLQAPFPNASDTTPTGGVMSFPIAGGAVAIAVNLNGMCTNTNGTGGTTAYPASLNLTDSEFEAIWQGTINQWNDPALVATNPILGGPAGAGHDNCSGTIQRIVRTDNSGTSAITKTDLNGINTGTLCDGSAAAANTFGAWATLAQQGPNTHWPTGANCKDTNGHVAPAVYAAGTIDTGAGGATNTGSGPLINLLNSTTGGPARATADCPNGTNTCGGQGGIAYAELGLWPALTTGVSFAHLSNAAGSAFVSPGSPGSRSNCNTGANQLPGGGSAAEAVGLGGADNNWANDSGADVVPQDPTLQFENITHRGTGYPVCGLTFDFVYTGMSGVTSSTGPFVGMTNDALRTLYSYFTYVFSPLAQSYLDAQTYDELPAAWLPLIRSGFQTNY